MAVLSEWWLVDAALTLLSCLAAWRLYYNRVYTVWRDKGVPFVEPLPIMGSFRDIVRQKHSLGTFLQKVYREHEGHRFVGIYAFDRPILVIRDVDLIKRILLKDFHVFADRMFAPDDRTDPLSARNLFGAKGQRWKEIRTHLTPTFTSSKLRRMFPLLLQCARALAAFLASPPCAGKALDVKETGLSYTTDVIASCAFGLRIDSLRDPHNAFRLQLRSLFEFSFIKNMKFGLSFFAPHVASFFRLRIFEKEPLDYIRSTMNEAVDYREKNGIHRNDFLDLLIELKNNGRVEDEETDADTKGSKLRLEGDDMLAQAFVFLAGGFETSASTLSFLLQLLATHPDVQRRLRAEVRRCMQQHGSLCYEAVQDMHLLQAAFTECLRLYPVFPFLERSVLRDYQIPDSNIVLEKGMGVIIPTMGIHMDSKFYPCPEKFDPDRFLDANKRNLNHYTYLAFGLGPRVCIGMRMSQLTVKVGVAAILSQFEVLPVSEDPLTLNPRIHLLSAEGGIHLKFLPLTG